MKSRQHAVNHLLPSRKESVPPLPTQGGQEDALGTFPIQGMLPVPLKPACSWSLMLFTTLTAVA